MNDRMMTICQKSDRYHFSGGISSSSSSNSMRIDGVYKSSFCPLRCAQKNAPKKIRASDTLQAINK
jgi:hypothetical protein